jgi:hypothetical protein
MGISREVFVKPRQLQQAKSIPCKGDVFELGIPKVLPYVPTYN